MAELGAQEAMAVQGALETMAELGAQEAMAELGAQEAMVGGLRNSYYPPPPPPNFPGEVRGYRESSGARQTGQDSPQEQEALQG